MSSSFRCQKASSACLAGLAAVLFLSASLPAAAASLSGKDVLIIAKALGFLDPPTPGGTIAVVYSASDPASKVDADAITALFGDGVASRGGSVKAKSVDAAALGDAAGYVAIIAATGIQGEVLMRASKARRVLCITAATAVVQSGRCVMAVQSEPKVEITLNREAAQSAGISFASAFRMLIHEI